MKKVSLLFSFFVALNLAPLITPANASPAEPMQLAQVLSVSGAEQAAVKDLVEKGLYKEALTQWNRAYAISSFADTATGKAFFALLLLRNNIQVSGFEELTSIQEPEKISDGLKNIWVNEIPLSHEIWRLEGSRLTNQLVSRWAKVLPAMGLAKEVWSFGSPKSNADFKEAAGLFKRLKPESNESAWIQWQMALAYANLNEGKQAGLYFQSLLSSPQTLIKKDRIYLASARVFFQAGQFDTALKYYNMVSKDSDYWLEALEEKAWVNIRQKDFDKALAEVKTLTSPVFVNQLGPEPYYVAGVADIKLCDYYGAFNVLKTYKTQFKPHLAELQNLSKKGSTLAAIRAVDALEDGKSGLSLGKDLASLPRLFFRDDVIERSSKLAQILKQEVAVISQTRDPYLKALQTIAGHRYQEERQQSLARMKALAAIDLAELSDITEKLHVVEIEAIQHMFPTGKLSKVRPAKATQVVAKAADQLTFADDGEIWLDELDHYHVQAKGCSAN